MAAKDARIELSFVTSQLWDTLLSENLRSVSRRFEVSVKCWIVGCCHVRDIYLEWLLIRVHQKSKLTFSPHLYIITVEIISGTGMILIIPIRRFCKKTKNVLCGLWCLWGIVFFKLHAVGSWPGDGIGDHSLAQNSWYESAWNLRLKHVNFLGLLPFLYPFHPVYACAIYPIHFMHVIFLPVFYCTFCCFADLWHCVDISWLVSFWYDLGCVFLIC